MFDTLSPTQREIVFERNGRFVVKACPGSGKTYTTAARLAKRLQDWTFSHRGIAVIQIMDLLLNLPNPAGDIRDWVHEASRVLRDKDIHMQLRLKNNCEEYYFDQLFKNSTASGANFRIGTVHTVKGETFEAVLLILKEKGAKGAYYRTLLEQGKTTLNNEELRVVYVGATRPRKILVLAVPNEQSKRAWEQALF